MARSLSYVDVSYNTLTGVIPDSITNIITVVFSSVFQSVLDVRLNFLCCCGVGPLVHDPYYVNIRYKLRNPVLPCT